MYFVNSPGAPSLFSSSTAFSHSNSNYPCEGVTVNHNGSGSDEGVYSKKCQQQQQQQQQHSAHVASNVRRPSASSYDYDCWGGALGCVICVMLFLFLLFALSYPLSYHYGWNDRNRNGIPDHREWPYSYYYSPNGYYAHPY